MTVAAAVASSAVSSSSLVSLDASDPLTDLSTAAGFVASDYPKNDAYEHSQAVNGDFRAVCVSDGAGDFKKTYFYLYHPSGIKKGYWDGSDYSTAGGYKVKVAVSSSYDNYQRYDAALCSISADGLFWKFRIDNDFGYVGTDARGYDFSSFEILNGDKSKSNSYALGDRFTLTGSGGSKTLTHETFDVVSLSPVTWAFLIPGDNGHKSDTTMGFVSTSSALTMSEVFSMMFSLPKTYGDVCGIRLNWTSSYKQATYNSASKTTTVTKIENESSPKLNKVDFTDRDRISVSGWSESEAASRGLLYRISSFVLNNTSRDWSFPAMEKCSLKSGAIYTAEDTLAGNPYLVSKAAKSDCEALFSDTTSDVWVLHFDERDFITSQTWPISAWSSILESAFIPFGTLIDALRVVFQGGDFTTSAWEMSDISILELQMMKAGKSYVLAVSADSSYIDGTEAKAPESTTGRDWAVLIRVAIAVSAMIGLLYVFAKHVSISTQNKGGSKDDD